MTANPRTRRTIAFSLIEVTLSLGVVSFALLSVLALLPLGLKMIQESEQQQGIANILSQARGQAEQMSQSDMSSTVGATNLYDIYGSRELAALTLTAIYHTNAYFKVVTYLTNAPSVGSYTYAPLNAVNLVVVITYPLNVSVPVNPTPYPTSKVITNTIFAARQAGN